MNYHLAAALTDARAGDLQQAADDQERESSRRTRRRSRARTALPLMLLAGATGALLLGQTRQAEAATSKDGCIVHPGPENGEVGVFGTTRPQILPTLDSQGRKQARYRYTVRCSPNRTVEIRQNAYERDAGQPGDSGGDDHFARWFWRWNFGASGGPGGLHGPTYYVPDLDSDPYVELYHQISFRVISNGVEGAWTPVEKGNVISVHI